MKPPQAENPGEHEHHEEHRLRHEERPLVAERCERMQGGNLLKCLDHTAVKAATDIPKIICNPLPAVSPVNNEPTVRPVEVRRNGGEFKPFAARAALVPRQRGRVL